MHVRRLLVVAALVVLALGVEGAGGAKAATYLLPAKTLHAGAGSHWTGTGYDRTCTVGSTAAPCNVFVDGETAVPGSNGLVCVRIVVDLGGRMMEERGCGDGTVAVDDLLADGRVVATIPSTVYDLSPSDPAPPVNGTITIDLSAVGTGIPYQGFAQVCGGDLVPVMPCLGHDLVDRDGRAAASVTGSAMGVAFSFDDGPATLGISRSV